MVSATDFQARSGDWMTAKEAAAYLRLPSVKALYQRVARGQLKAHRFGRTHRYRIRDLDAALAGGGRQ